MCPFLVLLRALPDADSQVSSKEHVQECGDLVGHLETKSLANHYVPWIAIFPIHLQYRSLSYLKSHTIRESYHLYTSPKQNWQTFANSMGKAVLAIFTGAKVKTSPDMTIPTTLCQKIKWVQKKGTNFLWAPAYSPEPPQSNGMLHLVLLDSF